MFDQETLDRLTVRDIGELRRVMEIMAKYKVSLPTVIKSVAVVGHGMGHWRYYPPYDDFEAALEEYNRIAAHDGYSWTPPSERM